MYNFNELNPYISSINSIISNPIDYIDQSICCNNECKNTETKTFGIFKIFRNFIIRDIIDIKIDKERKFVEITTIDNKKYKSVAIGDDDFSIEGGIAICVLKMLLDGSEANKLINDIIKINKTKIDKEEKKKQEEKRIKEIKERKRKKKEKYIQKCRDKEKQRQIDIQKEAYKLAMKEINEEKHKSNKENK